MIMSLLIAIAIIHGLKLDNALYWYLAVAVSATFDFFNLAARAVKITQEVKDIILKVITNELVKQEGKIINLLGDVMKERSSKVIRQIVHTGDQIREELLELKLRG